MDYAMARALQRRAFECRDTERILGDMSPCAEAVWHGGGRPVAAWGCYGSPVMFVDMTHPSSGGAEPASTSAGWGEYLSSVVPPDFDRHPGYAFHREVLALLSDTWEDELERTLCPATDAVYAAVVCCPAAEACTSGAADRCGRRFLLPLITIVEPAAVIVRGQFASEWMFRYTEPTPAPDETIGPVETWHGAVKVAAVGHHAFPLIFSDDGMDADAGMIADCLARVCEPTDFFMPGGCGLHPSCPKLSTARALEFFAATL